MELACITDDCSEPDVLAHFWNGALRWGGVALTPDGNNATCANKWTYLEFVRVPGDKVGKNRLHLGCVAGSLNELEVEVERLLSLGATIAWEEEFSPDVAAGFRNIVLRDPEGNEFCVSGSTPRGP